MTYQFQARSSNAACAIPSYAKKDIYLQNIKTDLPTKYFLSWKYTWKIQTGYLPQWVLLCPYATLFCWSWVCSVVLKPTQMYRGFELCFHSIFIHFNEFISNAVGSRSTTVAGQRQRAMAFTSSEQSFIFRRIWHSCWTASCFPRQSANSCNYQMDNTGNSDTIKFNRILESFNLKQHVNGSNHNKGHTLDLIITRAEDELVSGIRRHSGTMRTLARLNGNVGSLSVTGKRSGWVSTDKCTLNNAWLWITC